VRDLNICKLNLPGCTKVATCVDHRQEPGPPNHGRDDLFWNPNNLQASCRACNTAKRNKHRNELARQAERQNSPSRDW
jgi:hypothetical protein